MKVIAGLGNPGPRYRNTRHNAGFLVLDELASRFGVSLDREKHKALLAEVSRGGGRVVLMKPLTYMNRSGQAVAPVIRNAPNGPGDLLVVVDDADLPLGRLRLRLKGSAGGHNGLKSIIEHVGSQDFARLRIGVGKEKGSSGLADHVLASFTPGERETLEHVLKRAADGVLLYLNEGAERAMNEVNQSD